ncbi:MAG TPA: beta-ketoacyl synthase N-terminal-like domain-containing protein [Myxococcota bacterium]|jgi:3-oxoacyl-[acyl-carrier-protein] synthase II|nr:beta-ketoacyl synthase N-terminal-like domain-containing protein [Myxococcota bacterium]
MRSVVVTGIGAILPGCDSRAQLWEHLRYGISQLCFEAAPGAGCDRWPVGRVRGFEARRYLREIPARHYERFHRDQLLYLASLLAARDDAGLKLAALPAERVGLFDGTSRGSFDAWYERIRAEAGDGAGGAAAAAPYGRRDLVAGTPGLAAGLAAANLGIRGPAYTFTGTCASGAIAIGHAWREVSSGTLDVAFASGHESALSAPIYQMYRNADLLTDERTCAARAVRPYVGHSKNAFGEGAVTLVLEAREAAERRGATILAAMGGYAYANNGEHPTSVDTTGMLPARLLEELLAAHGAALERVSFVVGHGNGVPMSDLAEIACMKHLFGERARKVPLLSVKPIYGHLLGASSALNVAAAVLMIHEQFVVPTINIDESRIVDGVTHQANMGEPRRCELGLSFSAGLGGHNAAVLVGTPDALEGEGEADSWHDTAEVSAAAGAAPPAGAAGA